MSALILFSILLPSFVTSKSPKIGIIGGGIAGTSCAYFLSELFHKNASISLFEKDQIGGRLRILEIDGNKYELGGAVIHPRNQYMVQFLKILGLTLQQPLSNKFIIYNGEKIIFEESDWQIVDLAKIIWRYGLSAFSLFRKINSMLDDFSRIYKLQKEEYSYTSVDDLLNSMKPSFSNMTQISIGDFLQKEGYSKKLLDELVQSIMLVNYGQTNNISSFAGFVSLAGGDSNLWNVKFGNYLIPKGLLKKSKAKFIQGNVIEVVLLPNQTFSINYKDISSDDKMKTDHFDIVVLAAPLIKDKVNIRFLNFGKDFKVFERSYHQTVATFVKGTLKPEFFHKSEKISEDILTNNNTLFFNSIGRLTKKNSRLNIYKVFSKNVLRMEELETLFDDFHVVEEKVWLAYPHYEPPEKLVKFVLHPGLYYTNAIELSASAMEMSAVAAKNVANLVYQFWKNSEGNIDSKKYSKDEL